MQHSPPPHRPDPAEGWLLVPMEVSALVVSESAQHAAGWYDLAPDFMAITRQRTVSGPDLVHLDARPCGPGAGVHLHWCLPDAFGHVEAGEEPPPMPDRWLVQRLRHREGDAPARIGDAEAWLVDSDHAWPDDAAPESAVTFFDATRPGLVVRMGRMRPLKECDWRTVGTAAALEHRLSALGPGTPEFAAHYPACRSLLGFHDTSPGGDGAGDWRLTYLVTGWFSRLEDDPLHDARDALASRLQALHWAAPEGPAHRRVLCHGAVAGVQWNAATEPPSGVPVAGVELAIADTAVDGIAALLAKRRADLAAPWLASLQYGLLDGHAEADDVAAQLQRHRYERLPGDDRYRIEATAGGTGMAEPLTRELESALYRLNAAARGEADRQRSLEHRLQDLYSTWARWADEQLKERKPPVTSLQDEGVRRARDGVSAARFRLAASRERRSRRETGLKHMLAHRYPGRALERSTAAPFYRRASPVLLAAGADLGARHCHLPAFERAPLRCRAPNQVLTHYPGSRPRPAPELDHANWPPPVLQQNLLIEAARFRDNGDFPAERTPEERALARWMANPWRPLFLLWSLRWRGAPGGSWLGMALLSPHPDALLRRRLADPDPALDGLRPDVDALGVVAQSLSGFQEALQGLQQGLQLPPLDPASVLMRAADSRASFDAAFGPALEWLDHAHMHSPWPMAQDDGAPGEALEFTSLRVVDAFGQSRDLLAGRTAADRWVTPSDWPASDGMALQLPPRWVQAARLDFRWRSVEPGHPGGSPVCGWLFANYLDGSLMVCDAAGSLQGALQRLDTAEAHAPGFAWVDVPGRETRLTELANTELRALVTWALALDADQAARFLLQVAMACAEAVAHPTHDARLSVLLGRPLALARAALSLQFEARGANAAATCGVRLGGPTGHAGGIAAWRHAGTGGFLPCPAHDTGTLPHGASRFTVDTRGPVELTLLFDPAAPVHVHADQLPRHSLWLPPQATTALANIHEVFFQMAPVLGPPGAASLPRPSDDYGRWSWAVRPDVTGWTEYPEFTEPAGAGSEGPACELHEGWLKLDMHPVDIAAFWVKRGSVCGVERGTRITLGWRLTGARTLVLTIEGRAEPLARWEADGTSVLPEEFVYEALETAVVRLTASDGRGHGSTRALPVIVETGSPP